MECFYHSGATAVGICKYCGRGICQECVADAQQSLACKDRCESEVEQLDEMVDQQSSAVQTTSDTYRNIAVWLACLGVLFGVFSVIDSSMRFFLMPMAAIFLLGAVGSYISSKRFADLN